MAVNAGLAAASGFSQGFGQVFSQLPQLIQLREQRDTAKRQETLQVYKLMADLADAGKATRELLIPPLLGELGIEQDDPLWKASEKYFKTLDDQEAARLKKLAQILGAGEVGLDEARQVITAPPGAQDKALPALERRAAENLKFNQLPQSQQIQAEMEDVERRMKAALMMDDEQGKKIADKLNSKLTRLNTRYNAAVTAERKEAERQRKVQFRQQKLLPTIRSMPSGNNAQQMAGYLTRLNDLEATALAFDDESAMKMIQNRQEQVRKLLPPNLDDFSRLALSFGFDPQRMSSDEVELVREAAQIETARQIGMNRNASIRAERSFSIEPTATEAKEFASRENLIAETTKLTNWLDDKKLVVGPVMGLETLARIKTGVGLTPELAEANAIVLGLKNALVELLNTGAPSDKDVERIMEELPDWRQPEQIFRANLARTRRNLIQQQQRVADLRRRERPRIPLTDQERLENELPANTPSDELERTLRGGQ